MTAEETAKGNKLIAEFMGVRLPLVWSEFIGDEVEYHKNWNWLMPVCKKVNDSLIGVTSAGSFVPQGRMHLGLMNVDIGAVWQAVVEFIHWYNTQNSENQPNKP